MNDKPTDWQPYWTAALKRHKDRVAAGCVSTVGAIRVGKGKPEDDPTRPAARGEGQGEGQGNA
jgi:hypothetical protein